MKQISHDKRGILGLDTVKVFLVAMLMLAVMAIVVFAVLVPLETTSQTLNTVTGTVTNETGAWLNSTTYTVDQSTATDFASLTITGAFNDTDATVIAVGNFTVSGTGFTNSSSANWNNVSVSYTYTYTSNNDAALITNNITSGTTSFFGNVPTFMTLLGVVVLILIIAIVIVSVGRFENRGSGGL